MLRCLDGSMHSMEAPATTPTSPPADVARLDARLLRLRPTFAAIDLGRLAANHRALAEWVGPGVGLVPVVKADAYGHGAVAVARCIAPLAPRAFAVALVEEGLELRRAGIAGPILLLGPLGSDQIGLAVDHDLTAAVYDRESLERFDASGRKRGRRIPIHLKIDTGMGRLGFPPDEHEGLAPRLAAARGIELAGVFTNFAQADTPGAPETARQLERLEAVVSSLAAAGLGPGLVHAANTAGVLAHPRGWKSAVRPGLGLYGIHPGDEVPRAALRPVLALETTVVQVKTVPSGTPVGYGGTWITDRSSQIATLPIGYGDGYSRALSSRDQGEGRVAGRVSMDLTAVDVTGISGIEVGAPATLIGERGGRCVTVDEVARACGTIPYETLCGIARRLPRVYLENGRVVSVRPPCTEDPV